jgi:hypothetical protein
MKRILFSTVLSFICILAMVSCDSVTGSNDTPSAIATASSAKPTAMHITRSEPSFGSLPRFEKTVTDTVAVQKLYHAALAMPTLPPGARMSCQAEQVGYESVSYHMTFLQGQKVVAQMDLQAEGCFLLRVKSEKNNREPNSSFIALFMKTAGISSMT